MKKLIYIAASFFLLILYLNGQGQLIITGGSKLIITPSTYLVNTGGTTIQSTATLTNSGNMSMKGDFTNNGAAAVGTGLVAFNGSATQLVGGSTSTNFSQVAVNNNVQLATPAAVSTLLNFQSGKLTLASNNLTVGSGGTLSGYSSSKYIDASSSGRLIQNVGASNKIFPVGTTSYYVPLTLNNQGTADDYGVRVFADVLNNGTSGGTIAAIDHVVDMSWVTDEGTPGGSNLSATCQWNASNEGSLFERTQSGIGFNSTGTWNPQGTAPASGSGPYTRTRSGITSTGALAVGDISSPMAINVGLNLNVKEFLEGPFSGTSMTTLLNSGGLIPLNQPYNTAPWNYNGTESVPSIPNSNVVDWVVVELRDAASASQATIGTRIARQAAFLLKNGQIVGPDGSSPLVFSVAVTNALFAVIWSRNHLAVMSASALTNVSNTYTYDFTTGSAQAYGGSAAHKQIGSGIWGMAGGDADASGTIDTNDKTFVWLTDAGETGYLMPDLNLDRQVDNKDKDDFWYTNLGKTSLVP